MKFQILCLLFFWSQGARAFPEMVRHGYVHCTSCHTNLVGGGLLNEYGRALSREALSQKTFVSKPTPEGDEAFAYGVIDTGKKWTFGGDLRLLQYFSESSKASRARFLIMQVDFDALYEFTEKLKAFVSFGRVEPIESHPNAIDYLASPRHGLEYVFTPSDADIRKAMRAGRFLPAYGIGFAEHLFVTRRELDLVPGNERYAIEFAWNNERASLIGTILFSEMVNERPKDENGGVIQWTQAIGEGSKWGVNYYESRFQKSSEKLTRKAIGAFGHFSFTKKWFGLIEIDRYISNDKSWGLMNTSKIGYELFQGLNLLGVQEYQVPNESSGDKKFEAYSFGAEWFPRPHWDLLALYRKERNSTLSQQFSDVVWLVGHFYL